MAAARGVSALVLVQEWNADFESPSLQEVRNALHAIHCETDFSALYARFLAERFALFQSRVNKQAAVDADNIDEDALVEKTIRDFHFSLIDCKPVGRKPSSAASAPASYP